METRQEQRANRVTNYKACLRENGERTGKKSALKNCLQTTNQESSLKWVLFICFTSCFSFGNDSFVILGVVVRKIVFITKVTLQFIIQLVHLESERMCCEELPGTPGKEA